MINPIFAAVFVATVAAIPAVPAVLADPLVPVVPVAPAASVVKDGTRDEAWRVCYYTNWAQYRTPPTQFVPEDIDTNLCSHLIYAFADMDGNQLTFYEPNDDEMYARFVALKEINPGLKTLLAVGGWGFGTSKMTLMLSSMENRTEFIATSIQYLRQYGFDGLDLDFEYPGHRGSPPEDVYLFTLLCEEMRKAFDDESETSGQPVLLVTMAAAGGKDVIDTAYEIANISAALHNIHLMSYDLYSYWDDNTGIHAPLYADTNSEDPSDATKSVELAAEYWVTGGCPKEKLTIGMPLYGKGWTLPPGSSDYSVGAPAIGPSKPFNYTHGPGVGAWFELCRYFIPFATEEWDELQHAPYAYAGDQWLGYDNVRSLTEKVTWLKQEGYNGWMIWSLDQDDFRGNFCSGNETYPLLRALNEALLGHVPG